MGKLKIFTDRSYLPAGTRHVVLLFPFWGVIPELPGDKDEGRFDGYACQGAEFFEIVPELASADVALLPFEWRPGSSTHEDLAHELAAEARQQGKDVIIFFNNDSAEPIPIDNAIVFRTSFFRSAQQRNEFALPGWSVDFLHRYQGGELSIRNKRELPVVGYCGYVDFDAATPKSLIMHIIRRFSGRRIKIGSALRGRALRALRRTRGLAVNFVYRTDFSGGCDQLLREEYVRNIVNSDYALVTRGAGNFSYRLYEVMSCGRIPVLVDSDCVLPFDRFIDWKKYCVWVDVSEIDSIGERVRIFHDKLTASEFEELQRAVRAIYEEWLSPAGFHKNLWRCITACQSGS